MSAVIVIARARPQAGVRGEFLGLLAEVEAASRADDGCVNYGYYESVTEPGAMIAVEEWRDEDALKAHLGQPHVRKLIAALPAMLDGPPEILAHDVAGSGPLPLP
ncbi:MAG: antibiotic biosynthesis monooxygenase [Solirubrobacterales bacterium]|nr:antibiotic biosynthesis monooxygenase [Solirubrobacterales bacterium]